MKKITFLLITLISTVGFAQTFDFTNADDGWTITNGLRATTGVTFISLKTVDGDNTKKNPVFGTETAGVDTTTKNFAGVTIKNSSANGPLYMRVSYPKFADPIDPSKRVYKNIDITRSDTEFKTYWIDVTNTKNWVGTMNDIQIHFKDASNGDYILPDAPNNAIIEIDKITFVASVPTTLKESFSFATDDDNQGFTATNGAISGPTSGILTFTPVPDKFAKLEQLKHHVNATNNKQFHITLKNNSATNDQLRLVSDGLATTLTQAMSTSDTAEKTYTFDLSAEAGWTGEQTFTIGIGKDGDGKASDDGTVEISSIVVDNVLSNDSFENISFTMYPNPASSILHINSKNDISKATIFNVVGKKVFEISSIKNNTLDISSLNNGIYFIKITNSNNNSNTQKLIKN